MLDGFFELTRNPFKRFRECSEPITALKRGVNEILTP